MKKSLFFFASFFLTVFFFACNDPNVNTATATDTTDSSGSKISQEAGVNNNISSGEAIAGTTSSATQTPLNPTDSTFASKAAAGNMFEVEAGNLARRNAQSERVKSYGAMMVQDHGAANKDLMSAVGQGFNMPNILPPDKREMFDQLRNLKGNDFDKRYISMMVEDHRKAIADYQKQSNSNTNNNLKAYAQRTLPVLEKHQDSAMAINNAIK